ncbi:MAG: PAS domain-containing protein [Polaromonas sp.]|uniref:PAS domain-containing protein n=1 Tax=Polaromonas sp. TaxID=1869339 RepID=UPI0025E41E23|nr:PAS domain-containing protein [Polaromonas sp.]MBI2724648.1 PAS domain-containing protein [Polaromonas sp.]
MRWFSDLDGESGQSQFPATSAPRREMPFIWLVAGLVLLSGCGLATALFYLRGEAFRTGEKITRSLAHVIEDETSRTIQAVDQRLELAISRMKLQEMSQQLNEESVRAMLREQLKELPFVRAMWVLDKTGRIRFDSDVGNIGINLSDREYFRVYQQKSPPTGVHLSAPVRSRSVGTWLISVSRPMYSPQGELLGVMVAALQPSYFDRLWQSVDLGEGGSIVLFRTDGTLMMRSPIDDKAMGKSFAGLSLFSERLPKSPQGVFSYVSTLDSGERTAAYRVLASHPDLVISVASLETHMLGAWTRFAKLSTGIWALSMLALTLLSMQLLRQAHRRQRTESRFRQLAHAMPQIVYISDEHGNIRYVNDEWIKTTGHPREKAIRGEWMELVHPEDRDDVVETVKQLSARGLAIEHEHRLRSKDGNYRWRLLRAVPNRNKQGKIVSWYGTSTDIDDLKQAQASLTAQAELLRMAGELAQMGGWIVDTGKQKITWSDEASRMLDLPPGNSPSLESIISMCFPEFRELTRRALQDCASLGLPFDLEVKMLTSSGRTVWVRSIGQAVRDAGGNITRLQGAQQDITTRVVTGQKLQAYLATLQQATQAAQVITRCQTPEAMLHELAAQARSMVGASRAVATLHEGLADQTDIVATSSRDGLANVDGGSALDVHLTARDGAVIGTLVLSGKAGGGSFTQEDTYVVTALAQLASTALDNLRLLAEVRELNTGLEKKITQRTLALSRQEALFRTLAEQAPHPIWTVDTNGHVTFFSRAWYQMAGGSPPDWHGLSWLELVHPEDRAGVVQNWAHASKTLGLFTGLRRMRGKDGGYHTMSYQASPVFNEQGQVTFWVGIDVDVTATKAIEAALRLSNQELETFSYSVSHDLRSPLGTIDGFSRLLGKQLEGQSNERAQAYLARIRSGIEQMSQLIEGMLSLATLSRLPMRHEQIDLSAMAEEILEAARSKQPERPASWQVQPGLKVHGDSRLIRALMDNLLGNAWKFSARKEQTEITVGRQALGGEFFVRDKGAGFDMAYAGKLFGTFQRLHDATEFAGTGIGLATVARIIARHGGSIRAESAPDQGATFFFTLAESVV